MKYTPTIGIECHVQLATKTKLFTAVDNDAREAGSNTLISPLCFGMPGSLPVLNKKAVRLAVMAGFALNSKVNNYSKFDRKHYFYPDSPLGYQITQFDERIIGEGAIEFELDGETVKVGIEGAHLEADAGKSTHPADADYSLVDLNRAGTPLLEIVSKPDIFSAKAAKGYAQELQRRMKFAGVSDASLFYGNMRFDVNISLAPEGSSELGVRAEIKNLNSFKSVERAAEYEIKRQTKILESGQEVTQETRGWDDAKQQTFTQRSKEDAHDYRYFPEPNLPPIRLDQEFIDKIGIDTRLISDVRSKISNKIDSTKVNLLLDNSELLDIALEVIDKDRSAIKRAINWLTIDVLGILGAEDIEELDLSTMKLTADNLVDMNSMIESGDLSSSAAKSLLEKLLDSGGEAKEVAENNSLIQKSDSNEIEAIVQVVVDKNPDVVEQIKAGEDKAIGFLVGQVMKESKGQANPQMAQAAIRKIIRL